jgi:hypothetical protein
MENYLPQLRVQSSTASSITLSWDGTEGSAGGQNKGICRPRYTVHIKERLQGWITAYWYVISAYEVTLTQYILEMSVRNCQKCDADIYVIIRKLLDSIFNVHVYPVFKGKTSLNRLTFKRIHGYQCSIKRNNIVFRNTSRVSDTVGHHSLYNLRHCAPSRRVVGSVPDKVFS